MLNDKDADAIFNAIAKILNNFMSEVDRKVKTLTDMLENKLTLTVDQFVHDERVKAALKGADGAPGRDADFDAICHSLKSDLNFIEKCKGAQGREGPAGVSVSLAEVLHELRDDPEFIKRCTGPAGSNCDTNAVIEALRNNAEFVEACTPSAPKVEEIALALKSDLDFIKTIKPQDGKDADPDAIAEILFNQFDFINKCKGEKGENGEAPDPEKIAQIISNNNQFIEAIKGENGKDADNSKVAELLSQDASFLQRIKGEKGDKGEAGLDRPIFSPYEIIARKNNGVILEKNITVQFEGSLYQTTRKTQGTPAEDPNSYMLLVAAIDSVERQIDYKNRIVNLIFARADGERFTVSLNMEPQLINLLPSDAKKIKGDYLIENDCLKIALNDDPLTDEDFEIINLRGGHGEPGKRGRKGMTGNGIAEAVYGDGFLMFTHTDGREPLTVDLKQAIKETLKELAVI